jgi:hypothetical protein
MEQCSAPEFQGKIARYTPRPVTSLMMTTITTITKIMWIKAPPR